MSGSTGNQPLFAVLLLATGLALAAVACGDDGGGTTVTDADADAGDDTGGDLPADVPDDVAPDADAAPDLQPDPDVTLDLVDAFDADLDLFEPPEELTSFTAVSRDGTTVGLSSIVGTFDSTFEVPGNFLLVASDESTVIISSAAIDAEDDGFVVLTPAATLDDSLTWRLEVDGANMVGGDPLVGFVEVMGQLTLNIIWHQHQPSYLDPAQDQLLGPWVRKHATKDYFDMTAILRDFPDVHFNVNLTSSMLNQLQLYIERLEPYVDLDNNEFEEGPFVSDGMVGHTDPWIDLLLEDTPEPESATEAQLGYYYQDLWSTLSIAPALRAFFPEYDTLASAIAGGAAPTQLDLMYLKLWFELAWMDPDFLDGPVVVYNDGENDVVVDLSDVVVFNDEDGTYTLDPFYSTGAASDEERLTRGELLANRLVVENYKIMVGVIQVHSELLYDGDSGQIDVLTTPFYHPILPLLYDTDLAAESDDAPLPDPAFSYPEDVGTQIAMAVDFYTDTFGQAPRGMWPSEGAVAEEVIGAFVANDIEYIATDVQVLTAGLGEGTSHFFAYRVDEDTVAGDDGSTDDEIMVVFRDTPLSDDVSFNYKNRDGLSNAMRFVTSVLEHRNRFGEPSHTLSVILDGENAWEHFTVDHDAKDFHRSMYELLTVAGNRGLFVTTTLSEYIDGNESRGIDAHPINALPEYEDLFPASWISGDLATWIGEDEENRGWGYLVRARADLAAADATLGLDIDPLVEPDPDDDPDGYALWRAWQAIYAAEGSDWFWWFGADQTAAGGSDSNFDLIFRAQLLAMYAFANQALALNAQDELVVPVFPAIIPPGGATLQGDFDTPPTLDGLFTGADSCSGRRDCEWVPPAGFFFDDESNPPPSDPEPDDDIRRVYYGFFEVGGETPDVDLYIGLEFNDALESKLGSDYRIAIYTSHGNVVDDETLDQDPFNDTTEEGLDIAFRSGGPARQVVFDFSSGSVTSALAVADGDGGWDVPGDNLVDWGGPIEDGDLFEIRIPLSELDLMPDDPLEFAVVVSDITAGDVIDVAPNAGTQVVFVDPTSLVNMIFELDATGNLFELDRFVDILFPPVPDGMGVGSIVGAPLEFAEWTPNVVFMTDDGVTPDLTAGDQIFTREFTFPPGTQINYKYTIARPPPAEGSDSPDRTNWGCCEEFPITNRGILVPTDGTTEVRVRDIFTDRPAPDGSLGPNTTCLPASACVAP